MTDYYSAAFDNEASGPFTAEGANLTWTGGVGFIVTVVQLTATTGKLQIALVSGPAPSDNDVLTQGGTTADADGDAKQMLYPAYFREDIIVPTSGACTWSGPALGMTHSFKFDGQTTNVSIGEILTFSPGNQRCEVVTIESDVGASGELSVRFITFLDAGLPADNDTFTGDSGGDGALDGVIHDRAYAAIHSHRLLADLNDDPTFSGDDVLSAIDPVPSAKDTGQIVRLLSNITFSLEIIQHMYGGSIEQRSGLDKFGGLDVQVVSPNADSQPVVIANDAIVTDYWKNAYMPDSIAGSVRIMIQIRKDGVDLDGRRVAGALLENNFTYFFGSTTLGDATTGLTLVSSADLNNQTPLATLNGAPYNTIVITEGYQLIDYINGNGPTPYGMSIDSGSTDRIGLYERTKAIQDRTSVENLYGRPAQQFSGINRNFAYDTESGAFTESEILAFGTEVAFSGQTTNLTVGEVVTFAPSGARGRLLYVNDAGATGTLVFDMGGGIPPVAADTMTGIESGGDGTVDSVVSNANSGAFLLCALDDQGPNGNLYCQRLTGTLPIDNQLVFGATSNASAAIDGAIATRVINNQFFGIFTGTNFQTNFGLAVDPTDAIVNDILLNLLDVGQGPPNNQQGVVAAIQPGDYVTCYPWDGIALDINGDAEPDFDEMALATALTAGVSTQVDVGTGNIPDNTPQTGELRIERDSDGQRDLVSYSAHDGDAIFTLVGTAPSNAAIANDVMRALIDVETTGTSESFTAIFGPGTTEVAIVVKNGGPDAIKPFPTTQIFGSSGFSVNASRISDL